MFQEPTSGFRYKGGKGIEPRTYHQGSTPNAHSCNGFGRTWQGTEKSFFGTTVAKSGTEKQHVANDYAKRLSIGHKEDEKLLHNHLLV